MHACTHADMYHYNIACIYIYIYILIKTHNIYIYIYIYIHILYIYIYVFKVCALVIRMSAKACQATLSSRICDWLIYLGQQPHGSNLDPSSKFRAYIGWGQKLLKYWPSHVSLPFLLRFFSSVPGERLIHIVGYRASIFLRGSRCK